MGLGSVSTVSMLALRLRRADRCAFKVWTPLRPVKLIGQFTLDKRTPTTMTCGTDTPLVDLVDGSAPMPMGYLTRRRLLERQRRAFRHRHAKHVERHRDHGVVAEQADYLDHAGIAQDRMRGFVG